jgi:hypothetical protein
LVIIDEILKVVDVQAEVADVDVLVRAHFTLSGSDADAYLNEYLTPRSGATPDAFAFRINQESQRSASKGRLTIAKSLQFEGGLFAEWTASLSGYPDLATVTTTTAEEFGRVLGLFGLVAKEEKDAA